MKFAAYLSCEVYDGRSPYERCVRFDSFNELGCVYAILPLSEIILTGRSKGLIEILPLGEAASGQMTGLIIDDGSIRSVRVPSATVCVNR